jgi:hypothetical protein
MHGFTARGPYHHHHAAGEKSDRLKTLFAVIDPGVLNREHRTGQHDLCVKEIESLSCRFFARLTGSNVITISE